MKLINIIAITILISLISPVFADSNLTVDARCKLAAQFLSSDPEKAKAILNQLEKETSSFTRTQTEKFHLLKASLLGFSGRHKERIELVKSFIDQVSDPDYKTKFLYQLSASHTALGDYESALEAMNQSILMLPKVNTLIAKIDILQAAITLFVSLRAYDEALQYTQRMLSLHTSDDDLSAKCLGSANLVEIKFLQGERLIARSLMHETEEICDLNGRAFISLIVKTLGVVDLIDSGNYLQGIDAGLPLLFEFSNTNQSADNATQLEEALARGYLNIGNLVLAERYGLVAYQHAKEAHVVQLMEKTSETMAAIKRAQGQLPIALEYYGTALVLKNKILDEQLQKNIAYQRVKFDTRDKANQMSLLEEKNKVLHIEQQLEKRNNQLLLVAVTFVLGLLLSILIWLMKTLEQKNRFRQFSQTDGLTQVANRMHFMTCATDIFEKNSSGMSIILFDMDLFKKVNDTFGHATGDWVLKTVTEVVQSQLRKVDLFGRLGGEEFAICMPDSNSDTALQLAERCRNAIESIDTTASGHQFKLSASFGVASFPVGPNRTFKATLEAADQALYLSKSRGRNCVSVHHQ
ncbi:diguanylate cyclase (GGDEF)-like protein [Undibacterium sp. GrIS 1.8]|uniref:tetratricopeptide repeat-containing diguanylate cyclase n=1 Tax=Undibacterium sp. GrIS 1.8 TaxID=3143934 RepID=UPI00339A315F